MRYITEIRLENFQSHRDTTIHLTEGLNLIVGTSDAGKSAILRALNFVFYNQPKGTSFIQKGKDEAIITITWSDGSYCQRIKGDSRNEIVFQKPGEDVVYLPKLNKKLPDEFLEFLGNPHYDKLNGGLAYAQQKGQLFLVGLSDTNLPRAISELTGISDIEKAAKVLSSRHKENEKEIKKINKKINDIDEELINLPDLTSLSKLANECENMIHQIDDLNESINSLDQILTSYENISSLGAQAQKALIKANAIIELEPEVKQIESYNKEIQKLNELITSYEEILEEEKVIDDKLKYLETIYDKKLINEIQSYTNVINEIEKVNNILDEYNEIFTEYTQITEKVNSLKKQIDEKTIIKTELINTMISEKMFCPECHQIISEVII